MLSRFFHDINKNQRPSTEQQLMKAVDARGSSVYQVD